MSVNDDPERPLPLPEIIDLTVDVYAVGQAQRDSDSAERIALVVLIVSAMDRLEELGMSRERIRGELLDE